MLLHHVSDLKFCKIKFLISYDKLQKSVLVRLLISMVDNLGSVEYLNSLAFLLW